jgi:hypothetical protein
MGTKLDLSRVTLVAVDSAAHDLTRLAIEDCRAVASFGATRIFSDQLIAPGERTRHIPVELKSGEDAERCIWFDVPKHIETSHFLWVQYDSWIIRPDLWDDAFLRYDYIGAPWWYADGMNVGNGGFSLRSAKMAQFVAANPERFPFKRPEDQTLCREHRPELEKEGFRWAPQDVAERFAFECVGKRDGTFGFHGMFNWPFVLTEQQLEKRMQYVTPYIRSTGAVQVMAHNLMIVRSQGGQK